MKWFRKADEMELSVTGRAARIAYAFSTFALLIRSIYLFIKTGELNSWEWLILMIQGSVFYASYLIIKGKLTGKGNKDEE